MTTPVRGWREIYERSRENRLWFKRVLVLYSLLDYLFMMGSVRHGNPWLAGLGEFLASQLPLFLVGWLWEARNPIKILNPKTQSWAFLGDYIGLAPMAAVAALAFPTLPANRWFNDDHWWWIWGLVSLAIGAVFSLSFRKGEGDAYDVLRYFSYTKLLHNGVAFTVLGAFIVNTAVPVWFAGIWSGDGYYPELYTVFLVVWLTGAALDGWRAGLPEGHPLRLTGRNLHPQADEEGRCIDPEIPGVPTWSEFKRQEPSEVLGWADVLHTRKLVAFLRRNW